MARTCGSDCTRQHGGVTITRQHTETGCRENLMRKLHASDTSTVGTDLRTERATKDIVSFARNWLVWHIQ